MDTLQWAVNGYFLAGALIIVGGRVGDIYGRRLLFSIGTGFVLLGSVVAALAPSPAVLILAASSRALVLRRSCRRRWR